MDSMVQLRMKELANNSKVSMATRVDEGSKTRKKGRR
jgi:hypothetical protein